MASSQVGIPSSSPFGCVLRDYNCQEPPPCRDSNARAAFRNNLKVFVRNRVHRSLPIIPSDENSLPPPAAARSRSPQKQGIHRRRRNPCFRNDREEKSKAMGERESGITDQWVTGQAKETLSTNERHTHEAQILSLPQIRPDHSTSESSDSPDVSNLGASSLVQMWEARLSRSNSSTSLAAVSKTNLGFNSIETDEEASSRPPEVCEPAAERYDDWESDRTPPHDSPSSQGQDSDAAENERVSVADIIRRLTSGKLRAQNSLISLGEDNDQEQQPVVQPVAPSPRLRGRQAFLNLLMQIGQDRRRELGRLADSQAVSRFSHRGRIQSMLRLRFLFEGVAAHNQVRPALSRGSELGQPQGSAITLLRERFSTGVEHGCVTDQTCVSNSRSPPNNTQALENSPISNQISEGIHHKEVNASEPQTTTLAERLMSYATEYVQQDTGPSSDAWLGPSFEVGSLDSQEQETADRMTTLNNWDVNITEEEEEEEEEEEDVGEPNVLGTHHDWFSEISRPRRYWEDLRQAWYQEMLDSNSDKEEIRQLLVRRRVSTSLASDFRGRMDKLMTSLLQKQLHPKGGKMRPKGSKREAESEEEMGGREIPLVHQISNMSDHFNQDTPSLQLPSPSLFRSWDHFQDQEFRDDSDQVGTSSSQLHPFLSPFASQSYNQGSPQSSSSISCPSISCNMSDHPNQDTSSLQFPSPLFRVWGPFQDQEVRDDPFQDQEVRDDPDQAGSASLQRHPSPSPSASQSYNQEMDLIYDLRGQMEQLHHEMAELRKSIRGCMNMQVKLQLLMKQKVSAASHSDGRRQGKKSLNSAPRNGNCCICYEMEIDSLLYRCGHMCTCVNCAYELQSSTGKCPICRASIVDVVRAYAHA